jgi:DNA-binding MarR family transcriptional regulator
MARTVRPSAEAKPGAGSERGGKDLTDREKAEEILLVLGRLGVTVHDALVARVRAELVGNAEVFVITSLHLHGPLRPSDIVEATRMTSGGVTKLIDRLESGGYITRQLGAVATDRRATRLILTAKGARLARSYADALLSEMDEVRGSVECLSRLAEREGQATRP